MMEAPKATEDLWSPYKELHRTVNLQLNGEINLRLPDFESILRKHKQNFIALLQNPPKNAKSREELKKGMVEGITVRGIGHQIVSKELYQEAIILSDMYDLNEFAALDLLCTAQIQMPYYPGLPRGLVAVLLYYDGRKALVSTLRMLVQARKGVLWKVNVRDEVETFITNYTDQLCESGLFHRIFDLLRNMDLSREIDKLQQNIALGGPKHRKQVMDLFNDTRLTLADTVLTWSAQCGLSKMNTLLLVSYLREAKIEEEATGKLDNVNLHLISAFLYAVDLSILYTREDGEEVVQKLPVLSDKGFIDEVIKELTSSKEWNCRGLQGMCLFSFGICLYSLQLMPQVQYAIIQDEKFVDAAIELQVFDFMRNILLENDMAYTEEFIYQRLHNLITGFIVQMFSKLKELRMRADETARTVQQYSREGLEAPINLHRYFEQFLLLVAKLYSKDPLGKELMLDYWSPSDLNLTQTYSYHASPRAASLFKFIKLGGDRLPPTLFVPYLSMLSSLASCAPAARHCFNMLKQTQSSFNSTLSWDHFFMSFNRYYTTLRQEAPPVADTVYRRNVYHKGITPHEIEGLHAVLSVIRTVADKDDFSRLALCEHPGWAPLTVLLGLISCSIPIPLKAELLQTLSALSKSPETASQMWNNLEASQILVTVPSTSSYQPRGVQTELDEIESRMEEYPLTRALLELLHKLVCFGIPRTLGAGPRKPGFDPYLNFIINSVFLKFHTRSYKNAAEKWQVASLALRLIKKFVIQYEPHVSDFPPNSGKPNEFNSPPGFHVMLLMNAKSEFLNLILYIVDEGCRMFDSYVPLVGRKFLEDCTLYCLEIIERCLVLQTRFFGLLSSTSCSVLLTHLSNLLLVMNQRSLRPDHCINIMKYVGYHCELSKHALVAAKILIHITQSPATHTTLMNIMLSYEDKLIRSNFVECLDENDYTDVETIEKTKEAILQLLKQCLQYTAPNFSHYLFGFDLKRHISKTHFQLPGVLDFPRTCIHSLFGILRMGIIEESNKIKPTLLESAYHMLFLLVSNSNTSEPVLKYMRLNSTFLQDHLLAGIEKMNRGVNELNQLSWLLKTVAVELKVISQGNQIFYLKNLLKYLIYMPDASEEESAGHFSYMSKSCMITDKDGSFSRDYQLTHKSKTENYLVRLLSKFDFNIEEIVTPKWEYFDNSTLDTLLKNCETGNNPKLINVKKLHQIIIDELSTLQNSAAIGQRQAILQEIQQVLMHVLNVNNSRNAASSIIRFVDGWRQVVEVIVLHVSFDIVPIEEQQILHVVLLQTLLNKIVNAQLLPDVSNLLSGAVLLLLDSLRRCRVQEEKLKHIRADIGTSNVVPFKMSCLKEILDSLIRWIITSDITIQKLRINLYTALVTFLQLVTFDADKPEEENTFTSRLDSTKLTGASLKSQLYISFDVLSNFGDKLVEVICHDCVGGHEVCKMLAMASFSLLITLSGSVNWIVHMSGRGYLKCVIESILDSDNDLRGLLDPVPTDLKPLYLYESKVSLLARIASTKLGAELLLEQKLLSCFNNMKVFDYHPEVSKDWEQTPALEDFIPPVEKRYLKLWLPTFNICNAILTSLGTENESAVSQIIYFMLGRLDVLELILRASCPYLSPLSLQEVAAVTSIIARTATNDLINVLQHNEGPYDYRAYLVRLQKLMLALLSRFILSDSVIKEVLCNPNETTATYQTSDRLLYTMRIISNVLLYSKNLIANHGIKHEGVGVIFQPTLSKPANSTANKYTNYEHMPSLGVIVQQLLSAVQYKLREKDTLEVLNRKYKELPEMTSIDFKEFNLSQEKGFDSNVSKELALDIVKEKLSMKRLEMEHCSFIIEHSLYLLWTHLDYYMLKAIPRPRNFGLHNLNTSMNLDGTLVSASEATWKVSTDDISHLKHGLVSILNDSFSKQLVESTEDLCESDRRLIVVLLKKIKTLIQFVPVK